MWLSKILIDVYKVYHDVALNICGEDVNMILYNLNKEGKTVLHKLYRYAPWNTYTIDVIFNRHLYMASAEKMNDKLEFRIADVQDNEQYGRLESMFSGCQAELEVDEQPVNTPFQDLNKLHSEMDKERIESDRKRIGIICFTESKQNSMMWYNYADKYTGVCLEFTDIFSNENNKRGGVFGAVSYGESPRIDIIEKLKTSQIPDEILLRYFYKSSDWRAENEYRYINYNGRDAYFPFGDDILTAVYCGPEMREENLKQVYNLVTLKNHKVKVYKTSFRKNDFGFNFEEYVP